MKAMMRIAVGQMHQLTDETLNYAKQQGVSIIQMNTSYLPGEDCWSYEDLLALKRKK